MHSTNMEGLLINNLTLFAVAIKMTKQSGADTYSIV